ncbi:unannotated protein [freshwater metagenome]|uniref:Unannotated protein n=1 Tax=freshwater metagenome TaxID=449393 RepID=A0A6J7KC84_9ZZZZ
MMRTDVGADAAVRTARRATNSRKMMSDRSTRVCISWLNDSGLMTRARPDVVATADTRGR